MSRSPHPMRKKQLSPYQLEKEKNSVEAIKNTVKQHITKIQYSKYSGTPTTYNKSLKVNNLSKYPKLQEKD